MDPTPSEVVHAALDTLLTVVVLGAESGPHAAVRKARFAPLPPFPRERHHTERIVEHLTKVEQTPRGVGRPWSGGTLKR